MSSLQTNRLLTESWLASVEHHASLASTNDRARELAAEQAARLPALIVADCQTAGRGRGANRWWTGDGGLAFSLLMDPGERGIPRRDAPLLSLAAAATIVEVLRPHIADHEIGLHWPNDVFAAGGKLAGVLVEALATGQHIVGIGINTNNALAEAPAELRGIAVTLVDLAGRRHDHTELLLAVLSEFDRALAALATDPAALAARCDRLCLQRGQMLTIQAGEQRTTGVCAGVGPEGALLLDTATGRQRFHGGFLVKD